mmetsp:Transcript_37268/g.105208  ORF Transcript_37268/g.105208 Transcript_37268/m.105208 type:complete len:436 (-) Transcript_37268:51-1358(-)
MGTSLLQNRWKISYEHKLGEGTFGTSYKGLDLVELKPIAVKIFKEPDFDRDEAQVWKAFHKSVATMTALSQYAAGHSVHSPRLHSPDGGSAHHRGSFVASLQGEGPMREGGKAKTGAGGAMMQLEKAAENIDLRKCFIQLLAYSRSENGEPGTDADAGVLFLVTEFAEESLSEYLKARANRERPLTADELRIIHWGLVSIVCGLHVTGYVHLDLKPCNVMRVEDKWKLIDFDGAITTQTKVSTVELCYTPLYLAPEVATVVNQSASSPSDAGVQFVASRMNDVWSVGMCALEAVFLQPILAPWYLEWQNETGDDDKYYRWLADVTTEPIIAGDMHKAMEDIHPHMANLLGKMLEKDPEKRFNLPECLLHEWFDPIRAPVIAQFASLGSQESIPTKQSSPFSQVFSRGSAGHKSCASSGSVYRLSVRKTARACTVM